MSNPLVAGRELMEAADANQLKKQEEAIQVAVQWAQEKLENFMLELESEQKNYQLLKISYIVSRRTSVDIFESKKSDIGQFVKKVIGKLVEGEVKQGLIALAEGVIDKLLGSSSGAAKTEKVYEVAFDELGGLNRLDAFFFCYKFAAAGLTDFSKAIIGTCIVRSAAYMVDDNAYRVILTSCATLQDQERGEINKRLIEVATTQKTTKDEEGNKVEVETGVLEGRARLAQVIGDGVAHSPESLARRNANAKSSSSGVSAESQARGLLQATPASAATDQADTVADTQAAITST